MLFWVGDAVYTQKKTLQLLFKIRQRKSSHIVLPHSIMYVWSGKMKRWRRKQRDGSTRLYPDTAYKYLGSRCSMTNSWIAKAVFIPFSCAKIRMRGRREDDQKIVMLPKMIKKNIIVIGLVMFLGVRCSRNSDQNKLCTYISTFSSWWKEEASIETYCGKMVFRSGP